MMLFFIPLQATAVAKNASKSEERDVSDSSDKKDEKQPAPVFDELGGLFIINYFIGFKS